MGEVELGINHHSVPARVLPNKWGIFYSIIVTTEDGLVAARHLYHFGSLTPKEVVFSRGF